MKKIFVSLLVILSIQLHAQENFNMQLRSHLPFPGKTCANIWGYADSLNNEYALVGTSTGLSIVDVTNPDNPVLLFDVPSVENFWREVKTYEGFAYVTTEGDGGGLLIVDLRNLPDAIDYQTYTGNGAISGQISTIHALHIDNGRCYLYGSNIGVGGALILDLSDPWNPNYIGQYNNYYVHDGYVEGDTAWFGNIYDGFFSVVDVSNPSNPVELTLQETPGNFTHNTWLTDNNQFLLTTDEISNSYLASYDISDINNIQEVDRFQTAPGSNCIVHNTHVWNDYAVTSWYTEGVVVVDADRGDNLIEVAHYDFSDFEGDGFHGCWGVYPYLPSGNIIASDIETALWVLTPDYKRGCYLEGTVTDSTCGTPLTGVTVTIGNNVASDQSKDNGVFKLGTVQAGTYSVTFSKPGYQSVTINNLQFTNGNLIELNINMFSPNIVGLSGQVNTESGAAIENAFVSVSDAANAYTFSSDANGEYTRCDILPGTYTVVSGLWGYQTECISGYNLNNTSAPINTQLTAGYEDDFQFNFGWFTNATSPAGLWERVLPAATTISGQTSNPGSDASGDCNGFAYVTGNAVGTGPGSDDVDDGCSELISPLMDLSSYQNPYIRFKYWFFNGGGNSTGNDTLYIKVIQNGTEATVAKRTLTSPLSQWTDFSFRVLDYLTDVNQVRFAIEACDVAPGHLVEAGLDLFEVYDSITVGISSMTHSNADIIIVPNPSVDQALLKSPIAFSECSVFDLSGRTVHVSQGGVLQREIALPDNLPAGVYTVSVTDVNRQKTVIRWIKQ
jgi:choice-of-anchor B domain-containing protein